LKVTKIPLKIPIEISEGRSQSDRQYTGLLRRLCFNLSITLCVAQLHAQVVLGIKHIGGACVSIIQSILDALPYFVAMCIGCGTIRFENILADIGINTFWIGTEAANGTLKREIKAIPGVIGNTEHFSKISTEWMCQRFSMVAVIGNRDKMLVGVRPYQIILP